MWNKIKRFFNKKGIVIIGGVLFIILVFGNLIRGINNISEQNATSGLSVTILEKDKQEKTSLEKDELDEQTSALETTQQSESQESIIQQTGEIQEMSTQQPESQETTIQQSGEIQEISTQQPESQETTIQQSGEVQETTTQQQTVQQNIAEEQTLSAYVPQIKNQSDYIVAIDAGHQAQGNYEKEPVGPGASETKNKVAGGTRGVVSNIPEYELTLNVALKLKNILLERGYRVVMIRESNDVNISNAERAEIANQAKADAFIRIHADAADAASAHGMTALCQTASNPYNASLYSYSKSLSESILSAMAAETGARNRGIMETDTMSGINWAQVPVTIIEMGFMTNPEEDRMMSTVEYQNQLAYGMANGIENYFANLVAN